MSSVLHFSRIDYGAKHIQNHGCLNMKFKLIFKDRIGIVADISVLIAKHDLNIVSMEVERKLDQAHIYIELESIGIMPDDKKILGLLVTIPDLKDISVIETLPHEEKENSIRVVLDNISDGVISIDKRLCWNILTICSIHHATCTDLNLISLQMKTYISCT